MSSEDRDWLSWIRRVPGWLIGFMAFVSAVVGFIQSIQRDPGLLSIILVVVGVCGGILGCLYLAFKRDKSPLAHSGKSPLLRPRYPRRVRQWAQAGLVVIPLLTIGGIAYRYHLLAQSPTKVIVLVANFAGQEPKKYGVTETIIDRLKWATKAYHDIKVESLNATITAQDGGEFARKKGKAKKATMVLWGWYAVTNESVSITANFEVLRQPADFLLSQKEQPLVFAVAALERFTVQQQLSSEMSYLTLMTVGVARLEARAYDEAIALFTDALTQLDKPDKPPAQMVDPTQVYAYRGAAYLLKGDLDRALADIDQAVDQAIRYGSKIIGPYINRGSAYLCKLNPTAALADFNRAIEAALAEPKRDAGSGFNLGAAYLGRGLAHTIKKHRTRAVEDFDQAILLLKPDRDVGYVMRAQAFWGKKDYPRAIEDLTQAIRRKSDFAMAYLFRAFVYAEKGDHPQALSDADRAVRLLPSVPMTYFIRSIVHVGKGDVTRALEDINQAINLGPSFPMFYVGRAALHLESGHHAQALADLNHVIHLRPDFADAYVFRAHVHYASEDRARALADFTQAIDLGTESAAVYASRGALRALQGDYTSAIADYTKGLQLEPVPKDVVRIFHNRAYTYIRNGDLDEAIADFDQLLKLDPESVSAYVGRGRAYYRKGDLNRAMDDLNQVFEREPDNPAHAPAYYERGDIFTRLGETEKAMTDFQKVVALSKDASLRRQAEERLQETKGKNVPQ